MFGILILIFFFTVPSFAQQNPHHLKYEGKYLLSVSDADMVASAYVNGVLGPREGKDSLTLIDLKNKRSANMIHEVYASNSVAGPPAVLAVDKRNTIAYVIETFTPRPSGLGKHTFNDLKVGTKLTSISFKNPAKLKVIGVRKIKDKPDSISISSDGKFLVVTFAPGGAGKEHPIGLYELSNGKIISETYPRIPNWKRGDRAIYASWRPNEKIISIINETQAEVSFYKVKNNKLTQYGNVVQVGKAPFIGRFTKEGKHFLVNNLFWGPDVEGTWNEAPNGTIVNIQLEKEIKGKHIRHALTSQVMVGPSPEGFDISPDGQYVVSANMERSWLPFDDKRQSWFSSLSLIKRNTSTGHMKVIQTLPIFSILPEAVQFDADGDSFAVTVFDHFDHSKKGGAVDVFHIIKDSSDPFRTFMLYSGVQFKVSRGAHTLFLVD